LTCLTIVFVAAWAWLTFVCSEAFEMPPLKSVAIVLICCSQLPMAVQTLSAYASLDFLSELDPPQPAVTSPTTAATSNAMRVGDGTYGERSPSRRVPLMAMHEGGCSCEAVRYRLTSEPMFVHCCHCLNCQRQTGSAFVINLLIEADRVEVTGDPHAVDVARDDGSRQRIYRCPDCQVAVYSEYGRPEVKFVRAGTLDDPSSVTPDVHIYTRSKLPWVALPQSVPAVDVYYDRDELWPAASLARLDALFSS